MKVTLNEDSGENIAVLLDEPVSGTCGENVTWVLDTDGTLTISGTGDMYNYDNPYNHRNPWYNYKNNIKSVIIGNGVTNIGHYAFRDCTGLISISIPDSVTEIGGMAFLGCSTIKETITYQRKDN